MFKPTRLDNNCFRSRYTAISCIECVLIISNNDAINTVEYVFSNLIINEIVDWN